ncbi:hypothetical protein protein [Bacillus cereus G9241]|nr:hypothetical protein protein [Bacillus cereus G9241]
MTFDLIIRQLTFLYNNFAYVFSNLLFEKEKRSMHGTTEKYTVNEIKMCDDKKAAITIAASVTVFFYTSTGGYDLCYLETFPQQLVSPFAGLSPYFPFHQFLRKCHHSALFVQNETCDFVPFSFSFHDVFASLVYPF